MNPYASPPPTPAATSRARALIGTLRRVLLGIGLLISFFFLGYGFFVLGLVTNLVGGGGKKPPSVLNAAFVGSLMLLLCGFGMLVLLVRAMRRRPTDSVTEGAYARSAEGRRYRQTNE